MQIGSPADLSLNADVTVAARDRAGLERLLRYCARPIFATNPPGADLNARSAAPWGGGQGQPVVTSGCSGSRKISGWFTGDLNPNLTGKLSSISRPWSFWISSLC